MQFTWNVSLLAVKNVHKYLSIYLYIYMYVCIYVHMQFLFFFDYLKKNIPSLWSKPDSPFQLDVNWSQLVRCECEKTVSNTFLQYLYINVSEKKHRLIAWKTFSNIWELLRSLGVSVTCCLLRQVLHNFRVNGNRYSLEPAEGLRSLSLTF